MKKEKTTDNTDNTESKEKKKGGLPKGRTNNPRGRPAGKRNVVSKEIKDQISTFLQSNFKTMEKEMKTLKKENPGLYIKLCIEMCKFIIPRPRDEEEAEQEKTLLGNINKLFPNNKQKN